MLRFYHCVGTQNWGNETLSTCNWGQSCIEVKLRSCHNMGLSHSIPLSHCKDLIVDQMLSVSRIIHQNRNSLPIYTWHKSVFSPWSMWFGRAPVTFTPWNNEEKNLSHNTTCFIINMHELKSILSNYNYNSSYVEDKKLFSFMTY